MKVFILATCRKPELLSMTELVFKTLRVGFPTADVSVFANRIVGDLFLNLYAVLANIGAEIHQTDTNHATWIAALISRMQDPFWICDTDVIFFDKVEDWKFDGPLAGRRIPEWDDEFSGCITRARLHPSLLYVDPVKTRQAIADYESKIATTHFTPKIDLLAPVCLPFKGCRYFYDAASLLYHAIGGQKFTDLQLDAYSHFNFGTIEDVVLPRLKDGAQMAAVREAMLKNLNASRGMWRSQEDYYTSRAASIL